MLTEGATRAGQPRTGTPKKDVYWDLHGCIAVLCRASDTACPTGYVSGVFDAADGRQLNPDTDAPLPGGRRIDTATFRPMPAAQQ